MAPQNWRKCFVINCLTDSKGFLFLIFLSFCPSACQKLHRAAGAESRAVLGETALRCFSLWERIHFLFPASPVQVSSTQPWEEQGGGGASLIHCGSVLLLWLYGWCIKFWTPLCLFDTSPRPSSLWYLNTVWFSVLLSSQHSCKASTSTLFSSNNNGLSLEQLFLSALDGRWALVMTGRRQCFNTCTFPTSMTFIIFCMLPFTFQGIWLFFMIKVLDIFYYVITMLADNENLYYIRARRNVD